MEAFLRTLVFDQRLVTDELIDERYATASDPESLQAMASMGASFFDPASSSRGCCGEKHTGSDTGCC